MECLWCIKRDALSDTLFCSSMCRVKAELALEKGKIYAKEVLKKNKVRKAIRPGILTLPKGYKLPGPQRKRK